MRVVLALALVLADPANAQLIASPAQPLSGPSLFQAPAPSSDPAAGYVTAGQDEPGYRAWLTAGGTFAPRVQAFNNYLTTYGVAGVVPTWQLLRTASSWRDCNGPPFEVPPADEWPHVVQTLRYIKDVVIPEVGPVEPVSAYRNPTLNVCAGGAPASAHQNFSAVDLVPLRPVTRQQLMDRLCAAQRRTGSPYEVGLGFYAYLRFHIDTSRFRKWGAAASDEAASCATPLPHPVLAKATAPAAASITQTAAVTAAPATMFSLAHPTASSSSIADPLALDSVSEPVAEQRPRPR